MKAILRRIPLKLWVIKLLNILFILRLTRVNTKRKRKKFNDVWQKVWLEEGYATSENIKEVARHYSAYNLYSTDFLLMFLHQSIGTLRIIDNNMHTPVFKNFEIDKNWLNQEKNIVEVTLLTVRKEFRTSNHLAALTLIRCCFQYVIAHKLCGAVIAADIRLFLFLKKIGLCPVEIGGRKHYEGSLTVPAYIDFHKAKKNLEINNQELCELLIK